MSSKNEEINHGVRQVDHNLIKINVSHGPSHHELHVPAHCTFGHVKKVIEQQTGLESEKQRILFRGKEKEDGENLQEAGVRDDSKILVLEDVVRKEMKEGEDTSKAAMQENVEEVKGNDKEMLKALRAIDETRKEIDKLAERVSALEVVVSGGTQVSEKEFVVFSEFLMRQLLKLDAIEAEGEARMQRKAECWLWMSVLETIMLNSCSGKVVLAMDERATDDNVELLLWDLWDGSMYRTVSGLKTTFLTQKSLTLIFSLFVSSGGRGYLFKAFSDLQLRFTFVLNDAASTNSSPQQVRRVQNFHDILDNLKARNSKPLGNSGNDVSVTTEWETFDSELGSSSPPPSIPSSTRITQDWERLE
ncbi:hypothetical protein OIU84_025908 [Salix udensis]|uniref:Uncharacterized protein n=1 Tax=Salix udensis TaxID=889485 RepID=A0AAD6KKL4_9ROSI|nr:hypothetical protein OIU84_025908 [Salix udensis]